MLFKTQLVHGYLIKRYKRFMADIRLDDGTIVVAHTANSGSMKSCLEPNAEVYLTFHPDTKRKTHYTWEMIKIDGNWVGINTSWPNLLTYEALLTQEIPGLTGYDHVEREVTFGDSRFDLFCSNAKEKCFIEVKNVTLKVGDRALFPDAVTERGLKHLNTLIHVKQEGYRAVMLYIVQRTDVTSFAAASDIDPAYARGLKKAFLAGVEVVVMQAKVTPSGIELVTCLPSAI